VSQTLQRGRGLFIPSRLQERHLRLLAKWPEQLKAECSLTVISSDSRNDKKRIAVSTDLIGADRQ
jgi:hypothetical protein